MCLILVRSKCCKGSASCDMRQSERFKHSKLARRSNCFDQIKVQSFRFRFRTTMYLEGCLDINRGMDTLDTLKNIWEISARLNISGFPDGHFCKGRGWNREAD